MISERAADWKRCAQALSKPHLHRNSSWCNPPLFYRRTNFSTPIVAGQMRETPQSTSHSLAGIAPNDLRIMPQVQAVRAENMAMSSTSKQTLSTVVSLTVARLTAIASAATLKLPQRRRMNSSCDDWIAELFSGDAAT